MNRFAAVLQPKPRAWTCPRCGGRDRPRISYQPDKRPWTVFASVAVATCEGCGHQAAPAKFRRRV